MGNISDIAKGIVKNGFSVSNLTQSRSTAAAIGISAASLDQYFNLLPEQYRPITQAIAVIVLFFYNRRQNP